MVINIFFAEDSSTGLKIVQKALDKTSVMYNGFEVQEEVKL